MLTLFRGRELAHSVHPREALLPFVYKCSESLEINIYEKNLIGRSIISWIAGNEGFNTLVVFIERSKNCIIDADCEVNFLRRKICFYIYECLTSCASLFST